MKKMPARYSDASITLTVIEAVARRTRTHRQRQVEFDRLRVTEPYLYEAWTGMLISFSQSLEGCRVADLQETVASNLNLLGVRVALAFQLAHAEIWEKENPGMAAQLGKPRRSRVRGTKRPSR